MIKLDLHTHSIISYDGGITATQYEKILSKGILDAIAITDHNDTRFARMMHDRLGDRIIVGEEIMTSEGEIIGLFLTKTIPPGKTAQETVQAIIAQGGLVYLPHPFETRRKGIQVPAIKEIHQHVSLIEVYNARAFGRGKPMEAIQCAHEYGFAETATSDAHSMWGVGTSYVLVADIPQVHTITKLIKEGILHKEPAPRYTFFSPLLNKVRNAVMVVK